MSPRRIQRQRTKGWRMPEGAAYVGRPTMWGNPYRIIPLPSGARKIVDGNGRRISSSPPDRLAFQLNLVVAHFKGALERSELPFGVDDIRASLPGRDLACWCPLDSPCHADVLLEIANGETQ